MPLLARIPEPAKKLQRTHRLVTVAEPDSPQADAFRILRMNLAFANHDRGARTIMVTSAVQEEGKSTTVANLAVALARAGNSVALVDLDLRRPFIDRFFGLEGRPGLTEVALGQVELDKALTKLALMPAKQFAQRNGTNGGSNGSNGELNEVPAFVHVLTSGMPPPEPGEVVGWPSVADVLSSLSARMNYVLVDTPPMLVVGDALTLSESVDALVIVCRSSIVRRPLVTELRRQLMSTPILKLGFVVTEAEAEEGYGYTFGYGYEYGRDSEQPASGNGRPLSDRATAPQRTPA
jgi:polysaccharide biosynthesis transport protein